MITRDRIEELQRACMREFLKKFTKREDFLIFLDEFGKECQRRGIMELPAEIYETDSVGRNLANLLAILVELDFDMRMWNDILNWKAEKDACKDEEKEGK